MKSLEILHGLGIEIGSPLLVFLERPLLDAIYIALCLTVILPRTPGIIAEQMPHCSTINGLSSRVLLSKHLSLEVTPIVEETIGRNVFSLLILFQDRRQTLCRFLSRLAFVLIALQDTLPNGSLQVALLIVVGILPIHCASQALLFDVGTFYGNRVRIFISNRQLALFVGQIRCLCLIVPLLFESLFVEVAILHIHAALAPAIERHSQHNLAIGHSCLSMSLHSLRCAVPANIPRTIEGCMMFGRIPHIISHHIDEIEVLSAASEVDILSASHTRKSEPELLSQGLAKVTHQ